jgi:hypothetical protein
MPDEIINKAATKTEFSGPSDLLALAHKAADPKGHFEGVKWIVGERGAWSGWVCAAIKEKLVRDGHWPTEENALKAEILAAAEDIGLQTTLKLVLDALRAKRSAA